MIKKYLIRKIGTVLKPDGNLLKPEWLKADKLTIANYPWYKTGTKQGTLVKLLHNNSSIYILFQCEDKHIYSQVTKLNGRVSNDSCVEFFAIPEGYSYFNIEINCCGCLKCAYGKSRRGRRNIEQNLADKIKIYTSIKSAVKHESPDDNEWVVEAELPLKALSEFTGLKIGKLSGTSWKANFYRCGGKTGPQYACWSPTISEKPNFHRPEYFGEIVFE